MFLWSLTEVEPLMLVVLVMEQMQEELETIRSFLNVGGSSWQRAAVAGSAVMPSLEL